MPAEPLNPLILNDTGRYGLNTQASPAALPPQWLAKADNIILDEQGRISSRKGIQQVSENIGSTSANADIVKSIGEYFAENGIKTLYCGIDDSIYKLDTTTTPYIFTQQTFSTVKEGTATSVTPQTITDGNWQWVNFNHEFYGFQSGHMPINYNGSGWFDINHTSTWTIPAGITTFDPSCGMGKFGRMWVGGISEDPGTLYYSDTLIAEDYNGGASGKIDLSTVWGSDSIVHIAEFSDKMVIFGTENIVIYSNPWDPDNMVLFDLITGVGLKARDSVAQIGNDIVFLSASGLRSLERIVATDGKMPLMMLSKNIRDELEQHILSSDMEQCKAQFCLCGGFYLLAFPDRDLMYYFDFTIRNPDQTPRVTKFVFDTSECPRSLLSTIDGTMYMGMGSPTKYGSVAIYRNYWDQYKTDETSTYGTEETCEAAGHTWESTNSKCWSTTDVPYQAEFSTVWLDFGNPSITKILKRFFGVIVGGQNMDVDFIWYRDYNVDTQGSASFSLNPGGTQYIYGNTASIFGVATFTSGFRPAEYKLPLSKAAKVVQIEMKGRIKGYKASLQSMMLLAKQGKIR